MPIGKRKLFQFQTGAIKRVQVSRRHHRHLSRFNSKLARLEVRTN